MMDIYFVFNLNLKSIVDLRVLRTFPPKKDFDNFNWGICIFKSIHKVSKYQVFAFIYVLKLNKLIYPIIFSCNNWIQIPIHC